MGNNIFFQAVLANIPRLLGQLNRNPMSLSYGSFDRAFWHYRTSDISSARYQEAIFTLALLYLSEFAGNIYYNNKQILEWINAALEFTLSIQNKDGSFNEWYINEKSYVCTSFVAAALASAIDILGKENIREYEKKLSMLDRAANWLTKHSEELVFNQLAGSVFALAQIAKLTSNETYAQASREKFVIIEKSQSAEGWWSEYGGPDIGYLSLMIDYLAKYLELEKTDNILSTLKKACSFFVNFLHPNFTAGGEYMSRNTEYIIPSGFAYLSQFDNNAKIITAFNTSALAESSGLGPVNLDDRYLCYILYNWLQAGILLNQNSNANFDIKNYLTSRRSDMFFEESGLRVMQNDKYYFVANLFKGGAFRIYAGSEAYLDSGIEIKYQGKKYIANSLDYASEIENSRDYSRLKGVLKPVKEPLMKTSLMIIFKLFQLIFGRLDKLQIFLKDFLRKKMITGKAKNNSGIIFKREFIFNSSDITVNDEIGAPVPEKDFYSGLKTSYNFIPSSKYFTMQEINNKSGLVDRQFSLAGKKSCLRRIFNINNQH